LREIIHLRMALESFTTAALHKIFSYLELFVHESIVVPFFWPACITHTVAKLLHDYWANIRVPLDFPFLMPYTIQYW